MIAQAIRSVIGEFATKIANGQSVTKEEVQQATDAAWNDNTSNEYTVAQLAFADMQKVRMDFNEAKREPKSKGSAM